MQTNNKMREALGKIRAELWNNTVIAGKKKFALYEIADLALAAPRLNCEVGTAEEQKERHKMFCSEQRSLAEAVGGRPAMCVNNTCVTCYAKWAQMPYEESEVAK